MKILYVTSIPLEYNSSANMRNLALIQGIIELGHEVFTLSPEPNMQAEQYDNSIIITEIKGRYWMDIPRYVKSSENHRTLLRKIKDKIRKLAYNVYVSLSIYDSRARISKKIPNELTKNKFDIIISSSDPKSSHLIVENLRDINPCITKHWIQYWGDPFANDINRLSKLPKRVVEKEEYRLLQKADQILYVSPITFSVMKKKYPFIEHKMTFEPVPFRKKIIYNTVSNAVFTAGYFGDYYSKDRNIVPLVDSISEVKNKLLLVGNTDISGGIQGENIVILGRQDISIIRRMEEEVDLLVCVCNKKGTQIPGKIYHYSATNKPILLIIDGEYKMELKDYFKQFNRYYICENDKKSIVEALIKIKTEKKVFSPLNDFASSAIADRLLSNSSNTKEMDSYGN